jgi:hypothetical protein
MPNVVSAIDGTSHEIQIPSNEPQALISFKKYMPTSNGQMMDQKFVYVVH